MSASSLSLPIFLRINFLISYLIVTDSQNTFDWHTQRALLNDKKAGAGCTSRAFKHPGRDVTAPDVWPSILTDYTYDSELDNADGVPLASRRSSMFPEGNFNDFSKSKNSIDINSYKYCKMNMYTRLKQFRFLWLSIHNFKEIIRLKCEHQIWCIRFLRPICSTVNHHCIALHYMCLKIILLLIKNNYTALIIKLSI